MNGSRESSSNGDNVGKDNVVVAADGDSLAIGIGNAWLAMSRMKFRRD
ncbi:hypothetical protein [uncultured Campylobacter sp.]|nr:hypothetical protein [uncultured Campylobacter sp.]